MSWASGISPITTSTSDPLVGGPSPSTARPVSPAGIDPSRAAVRWSSSGESSSEVLGTGTVVKEEHYPKSHNRRIRQNFGGTVWGAVSGWQVA